MVGAHLDQANLSGANLQNTDMTGADLREANLSGVKSGFISGTPVALPSDWQVISGYLVGPEANLSSASLSFADLSSTNLSSVNLSSANLSYADLSGANLSGTDLNDANLSDVVSGGISGAPSACLGLAVVGRLSARSRSRFVERGSGEC